MLTTYEIRQSRSHGWRYSLTNPESWLRMAMLINLVGFWVISSIPSFLGLPSTAATIPFRAVQVFVFLGAGCLIVAKTDHLLRRVTPMFVLYLCFWALYSFRFFWEVGVNDLLRNPVYDVSAARITLYFFVISVPSILIFGFWGRLEAFRSLAFPVLIGTLISMIACIFASRTILLAGASQTVLLGRISGNDVLTPIAFGHIGETGILLGMVALLDRHTKLSTLRTVTYIVAVVLGAGALLLSGARGAVVDCILLVALFIVTNFRRLRKIYLLIFLAFLITSVPLLFLLLPAATRQVTQRLGSVAAFTTSASALERKRSVRNALEGFAAHPLIGSGLFQRYSFTYPHNTVVEAFMTTGIVGGCLYTFVFAVGVWKAVRLMWLIPEYAWFSLMFLDYAGTALLSGSLYFDPMLFGSLGLLLAINFPRELANRQLSAAIAQSSMPPLAEGGVIIADDRSTSDLRHRHTGPSSCEN